MKKLSRETKHAVFLFLLSHGARTLIPGRPEQCRGRRQFWHSAPRGIQSYAFINPLLYCRYESCPRSICQPPTYFPQTRSGLLISFYPMSDLCADLCAKSIPGLEAKLAIPVSITRSLYVCYVPSRIDRRDRRTSTGFAQLVRFPRRILMITAEWDTLALQAEELAERPRQLPGWHEASQRMAGCAHWWDKNLQLTPPAHLMKPRSRLTGWL